MAGSSHPRRAYESKEAAKRGVASLPSNAASASVVDLTVVPT